MRLIDWLIEGCFSLRKCPSIWPLPGRTHGNRHTSNVLCWWCRYQKRELHCDSFAKLTLRWKAKGDMEAYFLDKPKTSCTGEFTRQTENHRARAVPTSLRQTCWLRIDVEVGQHHHTVWHIELQTDDTCGICLSTTESSRPYLGGGSPRKKQITRTSVSFCLQSVSVTQNCISVCETAEGEGLIRLHTVLPCVAHLDPFKYDRLILYNVDRAYFMITQN